MPGNEIMRDDSTGKVMRDNSSGKPMRRLLHMPGACCQCFAIGATPVQIEVTIAEVEDCPGYNGSDVNGTHRLTLDFNSCDAGGDHDCCWHYNEDWDTGDIHIHAGPCEGWVKPNWVVSASTYEGGSWRGDFFGRVCEPHGPEECWGCDTYTSGGPVSNKYLCSDPVDKSGTGGTATWDLDIT